MDGGATLTELQCDEVIQNYLGHDQFENVKYEVEPFLALDGLIGKQYNLRVTYEVNCDQHEVTFFLKTLNRCNPILLQIAKEMMAYEKEAFFYGTFVPLMQSKGFEIDVCPKSYFCKDDIIVLQNLRDMRYKSTRKDASLDLNHCKRCLETLAKFHAYPIMYETTRSCELGRNYTLTDDYGDILEDKLFKKEGDGSTMYFNYSINGLLELVDAIPDKGFDKRLFKKKLEEMLDLLIISAENGSSCRSTLLHADLWSNNFLFKGTSVDIEDCKLVDFQTLKYGPPAFDVLQFILTNTRKYLRQKHEADLLTHYYDYFSELLTRNGFNPAEILTEREFADACNIFRLPAKIHAVVDRGITLMPDETFLEASKSEEMFSRFLFEDRGSFMLKSFEDCAIFRDVMTEDIIELYEMLLE